jgi:hypothetical protein
LPRPIHLLILRGWRKLGTIIGKMNKRKLERTGIYKDNSLASDEIVVSSF